MQCSVTRLSRDDFLKSMRAGFREVGIMGSKVSIKWIDKSERQSIREAELTGEGLALPRRNAGTGKIKIHHCHSTSYEGSSHKKSVRSTVDQPHLPPEATWEQHTISDHYA